MKWVNIGIAFSIGDGGEDAADTSGSFSLSRESPSESFKVFGDPVDILKYDIKDYNSDSPDGRRQTKICHLVLMERKESKSSAFHKCRVSKVVEEDPPCFLCVSSTFRSDEIFVLTQPFFPPCLRIQDFLGKKKCCADSAKFLSNSNKIFIWRVTRHSTESTK